MQQVVSSRVLEGLTVCIECHGCRTNLADSSALARGLIARGARLVEDPASAQVVVLLSCTVTAGADRDAGKTLRRAARENPAALLVLAGCLPAAFAQHEVLKDARVVVPGASSDAIVDAILRGVGAAPRTAQTTNPPVTRVCDSPDPSLFPFEHTRHLSRFHVKIHEGCDHECAYCIVPRARGRPISRQPAAVLDEIDAAFSAGFPEVVLSGTHLARYGADLTPPSTLETLMLEVEKRRPAACRVRLSSLEPEPGLAGVLARLERGRGWCRYVHVALQHASDAVLAAMRRPYRFDDAASVVREASERIPGAGIGLDLIVGFPEETDEQFEESVVRLHDLPFTYLHVFAFSPRPGTPAAQLAEIPRETVRKRSEVLRRLGRQRRSEFAAQHVGRSLEVVIEKRRVEPGQRLTGLTDNFLRVYMDGPDSLMGKLVSCRAVGCEAVGLAARLE